jgi:hypothetical protein
MPIYRYQGTPKTPPALTVSSISGTTTSASAATYYFWLQYRNIAGYSVISSAVSIAISAGQGASITIPSGAAPSPSGVDIKEYVILAAKTSDPSTACVVAKQPGYTSDLVTVNTPPFTISLTTDNHFSLSKHVATNSALPSSGQLLGMRRYVDDISVIKEWNGTAWVPCNPQIFNTYVVLDSSTNGQAIPLSSIIDSTFVLAPPYNTDSGSLSVPVGYWIVNDSATNPILQGTRIGLTVQINGLDVSGVTGIVGGLFLTFKGYVNVTTGVLDTYDATGTATMSTLGVTVPYQGPGTVLALPKDLPPGSAYWLQVQLNASTAQLNNRCVNGALLQFFPFFYTDFATYNPSGDLLGSFISNNAGLRRIVPQRGLGALVLQGSGNLVSPVGGSFSFPLRGAQALVGLATNTASQNVIVTVNGTCFVLTTALTNDVALRAIVGTLNGTGNPSAWAGSVSLTPTSLLNITVTYPTAIRSNYPDVIAGSTLGAFNAGFVRIYVQPVGGGTILQFEQAITPGNVSDSFIIGTIVGTNIGTGNPPAAPSTDFGLYEPSISNFTLGTTVGSSSFSTGTYRVAIAFRYASTVTAISHSPNNGCIYEATGSMADVFQATGSWAKSVANYAALAALPAASVQNRQARIAQDTGTLYSYDASSSSWLSLSDPSVVADVATLRAINAPIREGRRFWVQSLRRYTRYDSTLTGTETGSGIFKPNNLNTTDYGRHIVE